jgi:hypothetical protein
VTITCEAVAGSPQTIASRLCGRALPDVLHDARMSFEHAAQPPQET